MAIVRIAQLYAALYALCQISQWLVTCKPCNHPDCSAPNTIRPQITNYYVGFVGFAESLLLISRVPKLIARGLLSAFGFWSSVEPQVYFPLHHFDDTFQHSIYVDLTILAVSYADTCLYDDRNRPIRRRFAWG